MTGADYTRARKMLKLNRMKMAAALGIHMHTARKYEKDRAKIPIYIAYTFAALLYGIPPYGVSAC